MNSFVVGGMAIGLLVMLFYTPACLALAVDKMSDDVTFGKKLLCYIPGFNIIRAEYRYFGRIGFIGISTILFVICTIVKLYAYIFMYEALLFNFIMNIAVIVCVILLYLANAWLVFSIIKDSDTMAVAVAVIMSIFYPIGQWYINSELLAQIARKQNLESTFRG